MVVNLCTSSGHALYLYQVLWNYLEWYQSYRVDTISILKITKGNNSAKNVGIWVTIVNFCMSSGHERYQSYGADTNDELLTDRQTDGQTLKISEGHKNLSYNLETKKYDNI